MEGLSLGYLGYLGYQGGGQGRPGGRCLGDLGHQSNRAGEPGGGVTGVPGARAGEPGGGNVLLGYLGYEGQGKGAGVDGVFRASGVLGESR